MSKLVKATKTTNNTCAPQLTAEQKALKTKLTRDRARRNKLVSRRLAAKRARLAARLECLAQEKAARRLASKEALEAVLKEREEKATIRRNAQLSFSKAVKACTNKEECLFARILLARLPKSQKEVAEIKASKESSKTRKIESYNMLLHFLARKQRVANVFEAIAYKRQVAAEMIYNASTMKRVGLNLQYFASVPTTTEATDTQTGLKTTTTVTASMTRTENSEAMYNALHDLVLEYGCVAINFGYSDTPICADSTKDLETFYHANNNGTDFVYLSMKDGDTYQEDLLKAFMGEGAFAGKMVLIRRTNTRRIPKYMVNFACEMTLTQQDKTAILDKMIEDFETRTKNYHANKLKLSDQKQLALAIKKRARKEQRASIYSGDRYTIKAFNVKKDYEANTWFCVEDAITGNLGEIPRAFVEQYTPTFIEDGKRKIYDLKELFQVTFMSNFTTVWEMAYLWLKDGKVFYLPGEQKNLGKFAPKRNDGSKTVSTKRYVCITDKSLTTTDMTGAVKYRATSHGAAGARKLSSLYAPVGNKVLDVFNTGSHGISNKLFGVAFPGEKIQNNVVRIMAGLTGSTLFPSYENVALFAGEFGIGKKVDGYNVLSEKGLEELKGTMDGNAWFCGYGANQQRFASTKVFAMGVPRITMDAMIAHYENIIFDLTTEEGLAKAQEALDSLYLGTNDVLKASLEDKILIFKKNPKKAGVDFYSDMNGYKTTWDLSLEFKVPVLDMPQRNHSGLSKQLINKMFAANPVETLKLVKTLGKEAIDDLFNGLSLERPLSVADTDNDYLNMLVNKLAPTWGDYDISIRESNVKLALNAFAKLANKFKIPVEESANLRVIPDLGAYFGVSILPEDVMFTKDIKAGLKAILIKYPTIGLKEYLEVTIWGMKELKEKVNSLEVNDTIKQALIGFYANVDEGCAVLANSKRLMNLLAGMDFDYDMVIAFYDNRIVSIFKGFKPEMVDIDTKKEHKAPIVFTIEEMFKPLARIISSKSSSVGALTVEYDWFIQLLVMWVIQDLDSKMSDKAKRGFCAMLEAVLDTSFKDEKEVAQYLMGKEKITVAPFIYTGQGVNAKGVLEGIPNIAALSKVNRPTKTTSRTTVYTGLEIADNDIMCTYVKINKEIRASIGEQLKTCVVTPDNFVKIIMDIVRIARYDQEVTIDSVKTSIFIEALFNMNAFFGTFGRKEYEYTIDRKTGNITRSGIKLKKVWHIYDIYALLRDQLEAYALPKFDAALKAPVKVQEVLTQIGTDFNSATEMTNAKNIAKSLKDVYTIMASYMAEHRGDARAKATSRIVYSTIRALVRTALEGSGIEEDVSMIGAFAYYIAACTNRGELRERKSNYNNTCFPLETLNFATGYTEGVARVSEVLYYVSSEVEEGTTLEFIDGNGFMEDDDTIMAVAENRINGSFTIQPIQDRVYKEVEGEMVEEDIKLYATDELENHVDFNDYTVTHACFTVTGEVACKVGSALRIGRVGGNHKEVIIEGATYKNRSQFTLSFQKQVMGENYTIIDTIFVPATEDFAETTLILAAPTVKEEEETTVECKTSYDEEATYSCVMSEEETAALMNVDFTDLDFTNFETSYVDDMAY